MSRFETVELAPFSPGQMQALVADVDSYPRFLPFVKAARTWNRRAGPGGPDHSLFHGELLVGFKAFRGQFATTVEVLPDPLEIRTRLIRGPFRQLACVWGFRDSPSGCLIEVALDFEFSEPFLASLLRSSMDRAVRSLIEAFTQEAARRYGSPASSEASPP
jgi:coenzyme Q-binding protein COQ10